MRPLLVILLLIGCSMYPISCIEYELFKSDFLYQILVKIGWVAICLFAIVSTFSKLRPSCEKMMLKRKLFLTFLFFCLTFSIVLIVLDLVNNQSVKASTVILCILPLTLFFYEISGYDIRRKRSRY